MTAAHFRGLLVVIAHSGVIIPAEIAPDSLSAELPRLMRNVDWYTNWLYDFRDILGSSQLAFPYCNLILEANRHPERIDESVPLKDVFGEPVYKPGLEPDQELRQSLARKYLLRFHRDIAAEISRGKIFMLDAHSTVTARGVADNQIELMNRQVAAPGGELTYFCPDVLIESYASELARLLPGTEITVNESGYDQVYGHVCGAHSVNAMTRVSSRVPAILQETNQNLYLNPDRTPNLEALERLRRMINLRIGRQTFDFDCGAKALQIVMEYYGVEIREDELLRELGTDEEGTSYLSMIALAEKQGFQVLAAHGVSLAELKSFIDQGYPVIVILQAWADRYMTLADWSASYDHGHYAIVVDYQDHVIVFEDPASIRRTWLSEREFLARWHDVAPRTHEKLKHFAMVLTGKEPVARQPEHMD